MNWTMLLFPIINMATGVLKSKMNVPSWLLPFVNMGFGAGTAYLCQRFGICPPETSGAILTNGVVMGTMASAAFSTLKNYKEAVVAGAKGA